MTEWVRNVMPPTLASAAVRTTANALRSDLDAIRRKPVKARISANQNASKEVVGMIRQAMSDMQVTQEAFAIDAGITESVLSEAMNERNGRHFAMAWLWAQSDTFVLHVLEMLREKRGFSVDGIRATKIARIKELVGLILEVA